MDTMTWAGHCNMDTTTWATELGHCNMDTMIWTL